MKKLCTVLLTLSICVALSASVFAKPSMTPNHVFSTINANDEARIPAEQIATKTFQYNIPTSVMGIAASVNVIVTGVYSQIDRTCSITNIRTEITQYTGGTYTSIPSYNGSTATLCIYWGVNERLVLTDNYSINYTGLITKS